MSKDNATTPDVRLGYVGLSALVFAMMVGAGIFNIPQNMAVSAGPTATVIAWAVTAAGMLTLVMTFRILSQRQPELNAGMYLYARQGFGMFTGFLSAWGYWLCTAFSNVAYAVMLNDTVGAVFPSLLRHGWPTVVFGSALIWIIFFVVSAGMRTAKVLNTALSAVKFGSIALIVILLGAHFSFDTFRESLAASADASGVGTQPGLGAQVKDTMMVTLWCFIGIEGAVMMSARARRSRDVGRAGTTGFFTAWILYVLVSVLCFGVMTRARLAGLDDPSVAYVLRECCGPWAYWLVIVSVVLSLGGGWVAWSLVCAEVPYMASRSGLLPREFRRLNRHGIPTAGLLASSVIMQLFLLVVVWAEHVYLTALNITGLMILPSYLLSGLYLWKTSRGRHRAGVLTGAACTLFCAWMIYAGGIGLFFETSIFYVLGLGVWFRTLRQHDTRSRLSLPPGVHSLVPLTRGEVAGIGALLLTAAITLCVRLAEQ